jgi:hypothetical protein
VFAKLVGSVCVTNAKRLRSDSEMFVKRFQSDFAMMAQRLQSDSAAITRLSQIN